MPNIPRRNTGFRYSDGDDAPRQCRNPFQPVPLPFAIDDDDDDLAVEDERLEPDPFSGFGEPSASLSRPMGKLKTNRLRDRWPSRPFVHPDDVTAEDLEGIPEALVRTRRPEPDLPTDHRVWVADNHVTGTELSLRLALYLLDQNLVTGDIQVALTGYELTRRSAPRFPVASFLLERGYAPGPHAAADWRTSYRKPHALKPDASKPHAAKPDARFALNLTDTPNTPDLIATLRSGGTLRAHVSRGLLVSTRSPAEHKLLRGAIGRAITCESAERGDVLAAVVPRSKRFRELAVRWRQTECALRARLLILTVDRAGTVDGFPRDA